MIINPGAGSGGLNLTGTTDQMVGFDANGIPVAVSKEELRGPQGTTAYQYAKAGGYTGTEAQFRELMGTGPWLPQSGGTIAGNLRLKNSGNYGTALNFGDADNVHISEPSDNCMEIKARRINFVTSDKTSEGLTRDGSPIGKLSIIPIASYDIDPISTGQESPRITIPGKLTDYSLYFLVARILYGGFMAYSTATIPAIIDSNGCTPYVTGGNVSDYWYSIRWYLGGETTSTFYITNLSLSATSKSTISLYGLK